MTEQEKAIELLKGLYRNDCESEEFLLCYLCEKPCEECNKILVAIQALEKMIEMKDNCEGCTFYDGSEINKYENYDSLIPTTNADRIRNMTDEELADWMNNMCDFEKDDEPHKSIYNIYTDEEEEVHESYGDILEWLQKEVEE